MRGRSARLALALAVAWLTACAPDTRPAANRSSRATVPGAPASATVEPPTPTPPERSPASSAAPEASTPSCPTGFRCGPERPDAKVDLILVEKRAHRLALVSGDEVVATYSVAIGRGGYGPKGYEGDRITPTGAYEITAHIPRSKWHTFLALSYPTEADEARYRELVARGQAPAGVGAGSGIALHGRSAHLKDGLHKLVDWTLGCVALDNDEIDEIAARAPVGTKVLIRD